MPQLVSTSSDAQAQMTPTPLLQSQYPKDISPSVVHKLLEAASPTFLPSEAGKFFGELKPPPRTPSLLYQNTSWMAFVPFAHAFENFHLWHQSSCNSRCINDRLTQLQPSTFNYKWPTASERKKCRHSQTCQQKIAYHLFLFVSYCRLALQFTCYPLEILIFAYSFVTKACNAMKYNDDDIYILCLYSKKTF